MGAVHLAVASERPAGMIANLVAIVIIVGVVLLVAQVWMEG